MLTVWLGMEITRSPTKWKVAVGLHRIDVRNNNSDPDEAVLEIRYRKIRVLPPIGKQKQIRLQS